MQSENASPLLYIYSYGKFSFEIPEIFRNVFSAGNAMAVNQI